MTNGFNNEEVEAIVASEFQLLVNQLVNQKRERSI